MTRNGPLPAFLDPRRWWAVTRRAVEARLARRIALVALAPAVGLLLVLGGTAYYFARQDIIDTTRRVLEQDVDRRAGEIAVHLRAAVAAVRSAADSAIVRTALTDVIGREAHLVPFLDSLRKTGPEGSTMYVLDFEGSMTAAAGPTFLPNSVRVWVVRQIERAAPAATVAQEPGNAYLWIVVPVMFAHTGTAEGGVVLSFPLARLLLGSGDRVSLHGLALDFESPMDGRSYQVDPWGVVRPIVRPTPSSRADPPREAEKHAHAVAAHAAIATDELLRPLRLTVHLEPDPDFLARRLTAVSLSFGLIGLVSLVGVGGFGAWAGRRLAARIERLERLATAIVEGSDLGRRAEVAGEDEIARLADAFNHMLARVAKGVEDLSASEERFRAFLDNSPTAITLKNPTGEYLLINKRFEEWYGIPATEAIGRRFEDFRPPEIAAGPLAHDQEVLRRRAPVLKERDLPHADGTMRHTLVLKFPVIDPLGRLVGIGTIDADLSEQRRMEAHLRAFLDNSPTAITLKDPNSRFILVNRRFREWYGLPDDDVIGRHTRAVWPAPHADQVIAHEQDVLRRNAPIVRTIDRPHADGSIRHTLMLKFPVVDSTGRLLGIGTINTDLSEQKRIEARLQAVFDNSLIGVALYTPDKKWIEVNDTLCRMLGYTRPELDAVTWVDLTHPDDLAENLRLFEGAVASTTDTYGMRKRFLRKDGSILHAEIHVQILRRADGAPDYFLLLVQDISERIQAEERLLKVQRLDAIGQLTGGIAHDFNNLLQVIIGNAEVLADLHAEGAAERRPADMVLRAATRGAELTRQLLAFARRQPLSPRAIDVNALVAGMDSMLRRTLGEHVEIGVRLTPDLPHILADAAQLESALLNLAVNARDAMPAGGTLTIETACADLDERYCADNPDASPGAYVLLAVSDTGAGMAPEVLAHAFEPFFTTKEVGKGTGLGLSMVYGFVKQSGGHAKVYSEVGHGTTVKLYFPTAAAPARDAAEPGRAVELPTGTETILVVEDDAMVRTYVATQLKSLGYAVLEAGDGPEAATLLAAGAGVDLVFSDVVMPKGMTGYQLAAEVRRQYPRIKVVLTSGYAHEATRANGAAAHVAAILPKPYQRSELARTIRAALDGGP
jgi:PAS domain S-box-containing protein